MGRPVYVRGPSQPVERRLRIEATIEILHVGSASRDLTDEDPRGWRLGGGVTYAALTTARLGLRTAAIVGADAESAGAAELDTLRRAGVELRVVNLASSPVFRNDETPAGRIQMCIEPGRPLTPMALLDAWVAAKAWSLVPVAREIQDDWATVVPATAFLAVGWQGWLRVLVAGRTVERHPPEPSALLRRADLVGVSLHDLAPGTNPSELRRFLRSNSGLVVTDGPRGGRLLRSRDGAEQVWTYEAPKPDVEVDPTGAGDTFLAALVASLVRRQGGAAGDADPGPELAVAAAAASLVVEQPGTLGVPDRAAVLGRLERGPRVRDGESRASG